MFMLYFAYRNSNQRQANFTITTCLRDARAELEGNSKNKGSQRVLDKATLELSPNASFSLPLPLTFKEFKSKKG